MPPAFSKMVCSNKGAALEAVGVDSSSKVEERIAFAKGRSFSFSAVGVEVEFEDELVLLVEDVEEDFE